MKMLRISRPVKAQIRNNKPLTEKEEYLTEVLEDHLKNFQQKSYLFGLFNTYKWIAEQPKTSVRMLLWNFDSANGTQYLRQIFGDDPIPGFIMQKQQSQGQAVPGYSQQHRDECQRPGRARAGLQDRGEIWLLGTNNDERFILP